VCRPAARLRSRARACAARGGATAPAGSVFLNVFATTGKIMLPPSALRQLSQLEIAYPMLFEITNHTNGRKLHCGVLEFIANEGSVLMPHWMMQNLGVEHGDLVKVESATLPKGTYVKLRPQTKSFIEIANPKAVLENTLRSVDSSSFLLSCCGRTLCVAFKAWAPSFVLGVEPWAGVFGVLVFRACSAAVGAQHAAERSRDARKLCPAWMTGISQH